MLDERANLKLLLKAWAGKNPSKVENEFFVQLNGKSSREPLLGLFESNQTTRRKLPGIFARCMFAIRVSILFYLLIKWSFMESISFRNSSTCTRPYVWLFHYFASSWLGTVYLQPWEAFMLKSWEIAFAKLHAHGNHSLMVIACAPSHEKSFSWVLRDEDSLR